MIDFLRSFEHRPLQLDGETGLKLLGLVLGEGSQGLEVAIAQSGSRPTAVDLRTVWKARHGESRAGPSHRAMAERPSAVPQVIRFPSTTTSTEIRPSCQAALEMPVQQLEMN